MYTIEIDPVEKPKDRSEITKDLLTTMMDVMETIEHIDDAGYVLRMKLINNIEYLVDVLMEEYDKSKI